MVNGTPLLDKLLLPVVKQVRRVRARQAIRFRHYCLDLPRLVPQPVFVKVGANDGVSGDPCSDILLAHANWRGLLIEPVPHCFERLKVNFQDSQRFRFEQVAIGASPGQASLYYVDAKANQNLPGLPLWFDRIGSLDRDHIVKHLNGRLEPFIIECKVQVCPLSDVLMRNGIQDVHLLHVDAEGHDYEVLKTVDFARHAPLSIFVEHRHLSHAHRTEMLRFLRKHGYWVRDCGADYFAVNREANRRLQRTAQARRSLT